ncbi:MAG: glycosyltransferase family 4 protein [Hyphomicrobiales bacterium]|nr:glycosyltransferase family 4 protein [Hyphomicrobiales bacterium]
MTGRIFVNARIAGQPVNGQSRALAEILCRLPAATKLAPRKPLGGAAGHAWEQAVLPLLAAGGTLWSPSATGPALHPRHVVTLHDVAFLDRPDFYSPAFARFYATLAPALARTARRIVTVSEFSASRIRERLPAARDKLVVIGNGVASRFRPQAPHAIAAARAKLALPARYLLAQAPANKRKNLDGLYAAWRAALPALPGDLELVVSGKALERRAFGDVTEPPAPPRVRRIGFVDDGDMAPLLAGAEAFVFPSLYEGFGIPVIEAMACGTPTLTSNVTATAEVAGDAALLVDPASPEAMARGLVAIATDGAVRARRALAGPARAAAYSWDDAARRYAALFEDVATGR